MSSEVDGWSCLSLDVVDVSLSICMIKEISCATCFVLINLSAWECISFQWISFFKSSLICVSPWSSMCKWGHRLNNCYLKILWCTSIWYFINCLLNLNIMCMLSNFLLVLFDHFRSNTNRIVKNWTCNWSSTELKRLHRNLLNWLHSK